MSFDAQWSAMIVAPAAPAAIPIAQPARAGEVGAARFSHANKATPTPSPYATPSSMQRSPFSGRAASIAA